MAMRLAAASAAGCRPGYRAHTSVCIGRECIAITDMKKCVSHWAVTPHGALQSNAVRAIVALAVR